MILLLPVVIICALLFATCGSVLRARSVSETLTGNLGLLSAAQNDPRQRKAGLQPTPTLDPTVPLDLEGAGLVCVNLPGVGFPKTPALDRRVAPLLFGVQQEINRQGHAGLTYNYAFRSSCEQARVSPVGTALKAPVGTSAHEAGAAVDVAGLRARSDRLQIVAIFKQFSWRHGTADWPHLSVAPSIVGERDYRSWIKRQQVEFNAGRVEGNCKGAACGGL